MTDFDILGVKPGADISDIKRAYRKLVKEFHPDRHADKTLAQEKMSSINAAWDNIQAGTPNMQSADQSTDASRNGATNEFWKAYAQRQQEPQYERYQYRTWEEQGADEEEKRRAERAQEEAAERAVRARERAQAKEKLQPLVQAERKLRADAAKRATTIDEDRLSDMVDIGFKQGSTTRESALKNYANYRTHVLREELATNPPSRDRYAKELEAVGNPALTELFERNDRLSAALTSKPRGGLATMVLRDMDLVRDGMITSPDAQQKFTLSAMLAERALTAEQGIVKGMVDKLQDMSPEEKTYYASLRFESTAKSAAGIARANGGAGAHKYNQIAHEAAQPVDQRSPESTASLARNTGRLAELMGIERLSAGDDFSARDTAYLRAEVIAKVAYQAAHETEIIRGDRLFPSEGAERLSTLRVAASTHASLRADALRQQEAEAGLLGKVARRFGQKSSLAETAELAASAPLSEESFALNDAILNGPGEGGFVRSAAMKFAKSGGEYTKLHDSMVLDGLREMNGVIANEPNGEYLVARAITAKLEDVCDHLEEASTSNPQAQERIEALRSKLPDDDRVQANSRKLREVADGLGRMLPQGGELADLNVTLVTAQKGAQILTDVEQRRWAEEHFAGEQVKKSALQSVESAYEEAQSETLMRRDVEARELKEALGRNIKIGVERNSAPKNKALFVEASEQFSEIFKDGGYSDDAVMFGEKMLKSGLIHDKKEAAGIAKSIGRVTVNLERDQEQVESKLKEMRDQEASGRSAEDILSERNRVLANEIAQGPNGKATFAALRESMETSSSVEARKREAATLQRAATTSSGEAYVSARANAAYAQEAALRPNTRTAYQQKKRGNEEGGNVDISA